MGSQPVGHHNKGNGAICLSARTHFEQSSLVQIPKFLIEAHTGLKQHQSGSRLEP